MKRCKVCLTENGFPQPLEDSDLIEFSKIFFRTFELLEDLDERHLFCVMCKTLLLKSYTLILRASYAQQALIKQQQNEILNTDSFQNIRDQYSVLSSLLSYHKVEVDYFLTGDENIDEEEVDLNTLDTKDVIIKQEYTEYCIDAEDNMDQNYSPTQKKRGKKRKRRRKMVEPVVKKARKPYKKKGIIVETGPRPVDVTVDHIIEGKRRTKKLLQPELTQSDAESETYNIPLQQRKEMKKEDSEQEYNPYKDSDDSSSSHSEYYSTATGKRLKRPVRTYPRECELCGSEVQSGKDHYLHYVNYHKESQYPYKLKKNIVCDQCGKKFSHNQNLTDHLRTHKTERTIACEMCNKMFLTMKRKLAHIKLVHVPKQFFCDYCGKGFTTKWSLILHVRTHTGDKPHSCHICGVRYAHGGNLLVHIRAIHQNNGKKNKNKVKNNGRTRKTEKHITKGKKTKKSDKKATSTQKKKKRNKSE